MVPHDSDHQSVYATGTETRVPIVVTGLIKFDVAEIAVLDDHGSVDTQKKYVVTVFRFDYNFFPTCY